MSDKPESKSQLDKEDYAHVNSEIAALRAMLKENKKESKKSIDHESDESKNPPKKA